MTLSDALETYFEYYKASQAFLDNEYLTNALVESNPYMVKLTEIYCNENCIQHDPVKSLLEELRPKNKVMIME